MLWEINEINKVMYSVNISYHHYVLNQGFRHHIRIPNYDHGKARGNPTEYQYRIMQLMAFERDFSKLSQPNLVPETLPCPHLSLSGCSALVCTHTSNDVTLRSQASTGKLCWKASLYIKPNLTP